MTSHDAMHGATAPMHGSASPVAQATDVAAPQAIVAAFFAALSGAEASPAATDRFLSLFLPGARVLPAGGKGHAGTMPRVFSPSQYLFATRADRRNGFVARPTEQRSERAGALAQVWSGFELRRAATDAEPYARCGASFQLVESGDRWWIAAVAWDREG